MKNALLFAAVVFLYGCSLIVEANIDWPDAGTDGGGDWEITIERDSE